MEPKTIFIFKRPFFSIFLSLSLSLASPQRLNCKLRLFHPVISANWRGLWSGVHVFVWANDCLFAADQQIQRK